MIESYLENISEEVEFEIRAIAEEILEMPKMMQCMLAYGFIHGAVAAESENF